METPTTPPAPDDLQEPASPNTARSGARDVPMTFSERLYASLNRKNTGGASSSTKHADALQTSASARSSKRSRGGLSFGDDGVYPEVPEDLIGHILDVVNNARTSIIVPGLL